MARRPTRRISTSSPAGRVSPARRSGSCAHTPRRPGRRMEASMRIAFIGLGNMGAPMALNLLKAGHALTVHDVRREAAAPHLEKGARWADSPRAAAEGAELILTSLPGPAEVERVATGPGGVIEGAA